MQATAELLHRTGVEYVVLGPEESCTGDPARRSGNEFLFQMLAAQTVEVLNTVFEGREPGTRKIITTCPHCLNSLGREYPQLDGHYEVVHHTQLLNKLVREGKLVPVSAPEAESSPVTYHDPCYLGRHNEVYEEPRELVGAALGSGGTLTEMPRHGDRSMCCGAGGARMWMEERIGKRINVTRTEEALATLSGVAPSATALETREANPGAGGTEAAAGSGGTIAVGCPFCRTMLTDGLTSKQGEGLGEGVEIKDVAQMLLTAVKRGDPSSNGSAASAHAETGDTTPDTETPAVETTRGENPS